MEQRLCICNCKSSKCVKLYCECFKNGSYCKPSCNCRNCLNTPNNADYVQQAKSQIREKDPMAFMPKVAEAVHGGQHVALHTKGCHCKKSGCLKKYCECFQAGIPCSERCQCVDCKNTSRSAVPSLPKTNIPHHSVVNVVPSLSSLTNMSYSHPVDTGSPSATGSTQVGSGLRSSGTPAYLNRFTKNQKQKHAMSLLASLWQRNVTPITNSDLFDLEGDVEETEVRNLFTKFVNVRGKASDDDDSKFSTKDAKDKRKKIKRPLAEEWWYSTIERGNLVRKDENTTGTDPISPSYSEFSTLLSQTTAQGTFRIPYPTYEDALRVISLLSSEMSEGLLFSEERNFPSVATHNPIPTDDTKDEDPLEETSNDFESFLTIANSVNSRHDHSNVQNIAKKDAVKAMRFAMALNRQDDPKVSTPIQSDIKLAPLILPAELQAPVKEPEIEHVEPEPQPLPAPIESDMIYKSHVLRRLNEIELTPLNPLPLVGNLISTRSIDQTENEGTSRTTTPTLTEISEGHTPEHLESTILRQNTLRKRQGQMTSVNAQRFEDKSSRTDTPDQMSGRTSQTRARRRREPRDGARVWITDFEKEFSDHEDDPQNAAFKKSIRATNRRRMDGTTIDFEKRPMDLFPSVSTYFDPALHPKIAPFTHPNTEQILAFRAKLVPKSPESTPSPPPQADPIPIFNLEQQIEEEWKKANADFFTDIRAYFLRRVLLRFFDNKYKIDEDEELDLLTMSIEEQVDHILTSPQTHSLRAVFDQIPFPTLLFLSVLPKQPFSCQLWENELFRAQESAFPSTPSQHSQSLLLVPSHLPPLPQDTLNTSFASTQTQQLTSTFPLPKFESLPLSLPSLLVKSQKLNSDPHTPHSSTSDTSSLVDPHSQSSLLSPESLTLSTTSHTFSKTTDSIPVPLPVGPFPDLEPAKLPLPTFDVFEVLSKMNSIVLTLNGQWETTRKRFKTESFKLHTSPNFEPITPEPRIPLLPPVQTESSLLTDVTPIVPPIDSSMLAHQNEDFNMLWVDNLPEESKPYQFLISTLKMNGIDPIPFFSDLLTKDIQLEQAKLQNEAFISPLTSGEPIHAFNSPNPFTVSQPPSPAFGSSYSTPPSTPSAGPIAFLNSVFDTTTPSMLARPVSYGLQNSLHSFAPQGMRNTQPTQTSLLYSLFSPPSSSKISTGSPPTSPSVKEFQVHSNTVFLSPFVNPVHLLRMGNPFTSPSSTPSRPVQSSVFSTHRKSHNLNRSNLSTTTPSTQRLRSPHRTPSTHTPNQTPKTSTRRSTAPTSPSSVASSSFQHFAPPTTPNKGVIPASYVVYSPATHRRFQPQLAIPTTPVKMSPNLSHTPPRTRNSQQSRISLLTDSPAVAHSISAMEEEMIQESDGFADGIQMLVMNPLKSKQDKGLSKRVPSETISYLASHEDESSLDVSERESGDSDEEAG